MRSNDSRKVAEHRAISCVSCSALTREGSGFVFAKVEGGRKVAVTVSDTGIGIPKNKLASIFLPFEQVRRDSCLQRCRTGPDPHRHVILPSGPRSCPLDRFLPFGPLPALWAPTLLPVLCHALRLRRICPSAASTAASGWGSTLCRSWSRPTAVRQRQRGSDSGSGQRAAGGAGLKRGRGVRLDTARVVHGAAVVTG
jgi:hypothetical protein